MPKYWKEITNYKDYLKGIKNKLSYKKNNFVIEMNNVFEAEEKGY